MTRYTESPLVAASLRLITGLQAPSGAYPAAPTFSAYAGYCWFRDGAFIADAASAAGAPESAERFFDWCSAVLVARADRIRWIVSESRAGRTPDGSRMLPARFTLEGEDGGDEWWDFQLDGYGTWLWALAGFLTTHRRSGERWLEAVELTVDYLIVSWSRPCFDWWEEHREHVHVSTLACIAAGLDAVLAAGLVDGSRADDARGAASAIHALIVGPGQQDGRLTKWIGSTAVDGSLAAAIAPLGVIDPRSGLAACTIDALERHLTVDGGTHRYLGDTFYGGGQWPLLSCFLGLAQLAAGDRARAIELLEWASGTATADLELPEQVDRHLIAPRMRQEWIDRWGTVATPLVWSHAMVLRLATALDAAPDGGAAAALDAPVLDQQGMTR